MNEKELTRKLPSMSLEDLMDGYRDAARQERLQGQIKDTYLLAIINKLAGADDTDKILKVCQNLLG